MTKAKLLAGNKVSSRHSSVIFEAENVIQTAQSLPEVSKIVISIILPKAGSRSPRIDFGRIPAGLKLTVRGSGGTQRLFLYTKSPEETEKSIQNAWDKKRR